MSFRPRFSLLSLMLIVALLCVSISHWRTSRRVEELLQEIYAAEVKRIDSEIVQEINKLSASVDRRERLMARYSRMSNEMKDLAANDLPIEASRQRLAELKSERGSFLKLIRPAK